MYDVRDFAQDPMGQQLYTAVRMGYGFPGVEDVTDLTDLQLAFLHCADVERQRNFLTAIGEMFSG